MCISIGCMSMVVCLLVMASGVARGQIRETRGAARHLTDIEVKKGEESVTVRAVLDGDAGLYNSFEMVDPGRLVIDLAGLTVLYSGRQVAVNHPLLRTIRIGASEDKVRLVLDFSGNEIPPYKIVPDGDGVVVYVGETPGTDSLGDVPEASPVPPPSVKKETEPTIAMRKPETMKEESSERPAEVVKPAGGGEGEAVPPAAPTREAAVESERKEPVPVRKEEKLTGREIAQRVYDRDDGKDSYSRSEMILVDGRDNKREREVLVYRKDYGDLSKTLIRFTQPADIEGTGLLSWENKDRDDDQFLYLPELRRVRRIASGKKDRSFVNTDFTYEDLERRKVEKDDHRLLGEEQYGEWKCYVLESIPKKGGDSQYSKLVSWIAMDTYLSVKSEYYGKGMKLNKTFTAQRVELIDGILTITESTMADLEKNHQTITKVKEVKYNSGLGDDVFSKRNLEKY